MTEYKFVARRKPWLAGLLSGVQPGLGQLYNGEPTKAIVLALLPFLVFGPILLILLLYAPLHAPYNVVLPVLLVVSVLLAIVRDATRVARQKADHYQLKSYNKWYVYLAVALLGSFVIQPYAVDLITHYIEAFNAPSGSMAPSILRGDHILVDKSISWNPKGIESGDVIVFTFPEDESKKFIKRVVGLPGDTIHIRDKIVYVNDVVLDDGEYTRRSDPGIFNAQTNPRDNFGPVTVPEESYFVMGDNRDQSLDSRFFGYVSHSKVTGKVLLVYWSWDNENNIVRWDRIGQRSW